MINTTLPEYLLVDPRVNGDPLEKQGQIGLLIAAYSHENSYILRFEDGQLGVYDSESLLTLKTNDEIFAYLELKGKAIPKADFRALYNVTLFREHDTLLAQKKAMELARINETVRSASLVSLAEQLGRNVSTGPIR